MIPCHTLPIPDPPPPPSMLSTTHHSLLHLVDRCSTTPTHLRQAHAHILRHGHAHNTALLTSLLGHYTSHRHTLRSAITLFSQFPTTPPTFAWNLLIRAHTLSGEPLLAILLAYNRMLVLGVPVDKFTVPFAVRACARCGQLRKGKEVHGFALKTGFYDDVFLQNTMVHFYFECADSTGAQLVFDKMTVKNVVSWTTLLSGLVSCGELKAARDVFDVMPVRNVVSWTTMIDGYAKHGLPDEAVEMFRLMLMDDVTPNEFTFVGLLIACTELGSLELGRWVHDFAHKIGVLENDVFVGTALIDMYSNCGSLADAVRVFEQMMVKSLATWNSMITSLGVHGHGSEAVALFEKMEEASVKPDHVTFKGVLCACLKDGLVDEGCRMFRDMIERYKIVPTVEHWNCLAELLGQEGAELGWQLTEDPKFGKDGEGWNKLVTECKVEEDVEVKNFVCENSNTLEPRNGDDDNLVLQKQEFEWEVG